MLWSYLPNWLRRALRSPRLTAVRRFLRPRPPIFRLEPFEQRLFAGSMLSPAADSMGYPTGGNDRGGQPLHDAVEHAAADVARTQRGSGGPVSAYRGADVDPRDVRGGGSHRAAGLGDAAPATSRAGAAQPAALAAESPDGPPTANALTPVGRVQFDHPSFRRAGGVAPIAVRGIADVELPRQQPSRPLPKIELPPPGPSGGGGSGLPLFGPQISPGLTPVIAPASNTGSSSTPSTSSQSSGYFQLPPMSLLSDPVTVTADPEAWTHHQTGGRVVTGGQPFEASGKFELENGSFVLREGNSFESWIEQAVTIAEGDDVLQFTYDVFDPDTTDTDSMNDALEVALVDASGKPLVDTFANGRDAALNVTEGVAANGTGDGVTLTEVGGEQVVSIPLTNVAPGSARLVVRLVNNDDDFGTKVVLSGVLNEAPIVTTPDVNGVEGSAVELVATFTDAGDVGSHTAVIDWGDGSEPTTGIVTLEAGTVTGSHTYADGDADGTPYTVTVTVTDTGGLDDADDGIATVANAAPVVTAVGTITVEEGEELTAELLAHFTDAGFGEAENWTAEVCWDYRTNEPLWTNSFVAASLADVTPGAPGVPSAGDVRGTYTYNAPGNYTVAVRVTDDDGGQGSDTLAVEVTEQDRLPEIYCVPGAPGTMTTVSFTRMRSQGDWDNEVGVYVVDDGQGAVDGVLPGDPGYALAALNHKDGSGNPQRWVVSRRQALAGTVTQLTLPAGTLIAPYMAVELPDGSDTQTAINRNPHGVMLFSPGGNVERDRLWFAIPAANADGFPHFTHYVQPDGRVEYRPEDQDHGGDQDHDDPIMVLAADGGGTGLLGKYYNNTDFTSAAYTAVDPTIDFDWGLKSADPRTGDVDTFSVEWTGQLRAEYSETYTFHTVANDGVRLWVDGELLVDNWTDQTATEKTGSITLTAGQLYDVKVQYYDNAGTAVAKLYWSSPSTPKQVVPQRRLYLPGFTGAPPAPTGLTAAPLFDRVSLAWADNATNENGYVVERKLGGESLFTAVATLPQDATSYVDRNLDPSTSVTYRVTAVNANGSSAYAEAVTATPAAGTTVTQDVGSPGVVLSTGWISSTTNPGYYGPSYHHDGNSSKGSRTARYTPTLTSTGTYRVEMWWSAFSNRASNVPVDITHAVGTQTLTVNQQTNGGQWNSLGIYTFNAGTAGNLLIRTTSTNGFVLADGVRFVPIEGGSTFAPATPSNVTAAVVTTGRIDVNWYDDSTDEQGFKIERKEGSGGTWSQVATVGAGATAWSDEDTLTAGSTYYYRARSYRGALDSAYSAEASAVTYAAAPSTPTGLAAGSVTSIAQTLTWSGNASTTLLYVIERRVGASGTYEKVATVPGSITTYKDTLLTQGTSYRYRVSAVNTVGASTPTAELVAATPNSTQSPYPGPGRLAVPSNDPIQAEGFDSGINGIAWADGTNTNVGNAAIRPGAWVDISTANDGGAAYAVSHTTANEWMEYSVDVARPGRYAMEFRVASDGLGGTFHVDMVTPNALILDVTGTMRIPDTGGEDVWQSIYATGVNLNGGEQVLRVRFDSVGASGFAGRLNWFKVTEETVVPGPSAPTPLTATPESTTQVRLDWTDTSDHETSLLLERQSAGETTWTTVATLGTNVETYRDSTVAVATSYTYRLRAQNAVGASAWTEVAVTTPTTAATGLSAAYYDNANFTGTSVARVDATVNFDWTTGSPAAGIGTDTFSARWTGTVTPTATGAWTFYANTDDGARLWVNGVQLVNYWVDGIAENSGTITLTGGVAYEFVLEYYDNTGAAKAILSWAGPGVAKQVIPASALSPISPPPGGTKFFVADAGADRTFRYDDAGRAIDSHPSQPGGTQVRGAASNVAGDTVWTVDATGVVLVTGPTGAAVGSWQAGGITSPTGVATDGTDVWIVDAAADKVYFFDGGAALTSGTHAATASFPLAAANASPSDLVTDGTSLWVTDDAADKVFKYTVAGALLGSWTLDAANADASGVTIDPSGGTDLWVVDRADKAVYRYAAGRAQTTGSLSKTDSFPLAAANVQPEGIADPPVVDATAIAPNDGSVVSQNSVVVLSGTATSDASTNSPIVSVTVDGRQADAVDAAGNYFAAVAVGSTDRTVVVAATDASGATTSHTVSLNPTGTTTNRAGGPVDPSLLADVTPLVGVTYGRTSFDADGRKLYVDVTLTNASANDLRGPILLALRDVSMPAVGLAGSDGVTEQGWRYLDVSSALTNFKLSGGASATVTLELDNANGVQFDYALNVLANRNHAPVFDTVPVVDATIAGGYLYSFRAVDADGDAVTYEVDGPDGFGVTDGPNGTKELDVPPNTLTAGLHAVSIVATDARGATATQNYVINVGDGVANRAPRFVSTPVVDVYVGQTYEYDSDAFDPDGDALSYSLDTTATDAAIVQLHTAGTFTVNGSTGMVTWTNPASEHVGKTYSVVLKVTDNRSPIAGTAVQPYAIAVHPSLDNHPPIIVSEPTTHYTLPGTTSPATSTVSPTSVDLDLAPGEQATSTISYTRPVVGNTDPGASNNPAQPGTLSGQLFNDLDEDGVKDTGELVIPNWTVFLDADGDLTFDVGEQTSVTDSGGNYLFSNLSAGTYTIVQVVQPEWHQTTPLEALRWQELANFVDPSSFNGVEGAAASVIDGKLYLSHGFGGNPTGLSSYDIATNTWTYGGAGLPNAPQGTSELAGGIAFGKHYAVGGREAPTAMQMFDPVAGTWTSKTPLTTGREGFGAASWNNQIFAIGGDHGIGTVEMYDPITNTWTAKASMPVGLKRTEATVAYNGKIYVFGGRDDTIFSPVNTTYVYDIAANSWSSAAPMPTARYAAMAGVIDNKIVVFGGTITSGTGARMPVTEVYDPILNTWSAGPSMPNGGASEQAQGVTYDATGIYSVGSGISGASLPYVSRLESVAGVHVVTLSTAGVSGLNFGNAQQVIEVDATAPSASGTFERLSPVATDVHAGQTVSFDVRFTGDGQAHAYDAQFVRAGSSTLLGSIPVQINTGYQYDVDAIDPDQGDVVSYAFIDATGTRVTSQNGATINVSTGLVDWDPTSVGAFDFIVEAYDDRGGTDRQSYTVVVDATNVGNTAPEIRSVAPAAARADSAYRYSVDAVDADGDRLNYYLTRTVPAGMTIDQASGVLDWTPAADQVGSHTFTVKVTDGRGGSDEEAVTITVASAEPGPNTPPTLSANLATSIVVGRKYLFGPSAYDVDGDKLTFDLPIRPAGMAIDGNSGVIVWEPAADQIGSHDVIVRVNDGRGGIVTRRASIEVLAANEAPVITSLPGEAAFGPSTGWVYSLFAGDANGDVLRWTAVLPLPPGMTLTADPNDSRHATLEWADPQEGAWDISIHVTDGRGGSDEQAFRLEFDSTGAPTYEPPVITSEPQGVAVVGQEYGYNLTATDADSDAVEFEIRTAPDRADAAGWKLTKTGAKTAKLTWTPGYDETADGKPRVAEIEIVASDGISSVGQTVYVPVVEVDQPNEPAHIISDPTGPAVAGTTWSYTVQAIDPDAADTITLTLTKFETDNGIDLLDTGLPLNQRPTVTTVPGSGEMRVSWDPKLVGTPGRLPKFVRVTVKAVDGANAGEEQSFDLPVLENAPPVFTRTFISGPVLQGAAFSDYVDIVDPNGDAITFILKDAPSGMTATPSPITNGIRVTFNWTPDAAKHPRGLYRVSIVANDGSGSAAHTFDVPVAPAIGGTIPTFKNEPSVVAQPGQPYTWQVEAYDQEFDPISYQLIDPASGNPVASLHGATLTNTGLLRWTPPAQGEFAFKVRINDVDGARELGWTVSAASQIPANVPPKITSTPGQSTVAGEVYYYAATGIDPDNNSPLSWSLDKAPVGLSVDAQTGLLKWSPQTSQLGIHDVTLRLTDSRGGAETQTFKLAVVGANRPPAILNDPPVAAVVGQEYSWAINAADPDGDKLQYKITDLSNDETYEPADGVFKWTPGGTAPYTRSFRLDLTDGRYTVSGEFTVSVNAVSSSNKPPVILNRPGTVAGVGEAYAFVPQVQDPDDAANTLTWTLTGAITSAPGFTAGSFDASTGAISWTPTSGAHGNSYAFVLKVTDPDGAFFQLSGEIAARGNTAPFFDPAIADLTTPAGVGVLHPAFARDNDAGDRLTYKLVNAPAWMKVDAFGQITGTPTAAASQAVSVVVTDSAGASTTDTFNLVVTAPAADTTAPTVTVQSSVFPALKGVTVQFFVTAKDNVGVVTRSLSVQKVTRDGQGNPVNDGSPILVTLDQYGVGSLTMNTAGEFMLIATARDKQGNVGTAPDFFLPVVELSNPPVPTLTGPADGSTITAVTNVTGTITDDGPFTWTLVAEPTDGGTLVQLASGTGTAGQTVNVNTPFNPASLPNGAYVLRLEANDGTNAVDDSRTVSVDGELKLGNFRLDFVDLSVPVNGVPVAVTRTYDTLDAGREGDFGYGWTMSFRDVKLQTSLQPSGSQTGFGDYGPFVDGTRVWVTLPGGKREMFTFRPQYWDRNNPWSGHTYYTPAFESAAGVTSQLSVDYVLLEDFGGEFVDPGSLTSYNPANPEFGAVYRLTTKDGLTYAIDAEQGKLLSVTDLNGNVLKYDDTGVTALSPDNKPVSQLLFERDFRNRITSARLVQLPGQPNSDTDYDPINYAYDGKGDLVSVTNRALEVTRFGYGQYVDGGTTVPAPDHYLTRIWDARDVLVARITFDPTTRQLSGMKDAAGNVVAFANPSGQNADVITDALDYTSKVAYDDSGNPVREVKQISKATDPDGLQYQVVVRQFSVNNDVTAESRPKRFTTLSAAESYQPSADADWASRMSYDSIGNVLSMTDALGNTTTYRYGAKSRIESVVDPLGNATNYVYTNDETNRLRTVTDAAGNVTTYSYDPRSGRGQELTIVSGPEGSTTGFEYGSVAGLPLQATTDGLGKRTGFAYDASRRVTQSGYVWDDPSTVPVENVSVSTTTEYDAEGRVKKTTDPDGNTVETFYTPAGQVDHTVETVGSDTRTTTYAYDRSGNLVRTTYPDGSQSRTFYDELNRPKLTLDRYDPTKPDSEHRATRTTYDGLGRARKVERLAAVVINVTPNGDGTYTASVDGITDDDVLSTTTTTYDADGRLASVVTPDGQTEYTYFDNGWQKTVKEPAVTAWDPAANGGTGAFVTNARPMTTYAYDAAGRQTLVTDALGHKTAFVYDTMGRVTRTTFHDGSFTTTTYDGQGRKKAETDQNGKTTSYLYDTMGHLTRVTQPQVANPEAGGAMAAPVYTYQYDKYGNLWKQTDAKNRLTEFTYDEEGREVSRTLPLGQEETKVYDDDGRLQDSFDFNGNKAHYTYDGLGRVYQIAYSKKTGATLSLQETVTYGYDGLGRQDEVVQDYVSTDGRADRTTSFTYWPDGQLKSQTTPEGTINYEYFTDTLRLKRTYTDNSDVSYTYDSHGRLATVQAGEQANTAVDQATTYTYDLVGNRHSVTPESGMATTYVYDALNRLKSVTNGSLSSYTYTLDKAGHRTQVVETGTTSRTVKYVYDNLYRLASEEVVGGTTTTYSLDLVGNRLSKTTAGVSTVHTYDANDRLATEKVGTDPTKTFTYDANGSLLGEQGQPADYAYDARNKLVEAKAGSGTDHYAYNDDGIRVKTTNGGTVTQFVVDANNPTGYQQVLEEKAGGTVTVSYAYGDDLLSQTRPGANNDRYYVYDGLGSVRALTDSSGTATDTYAYDAFGNLLTSTGGTVNDYRYAGERLLGGSGLYDNRARALNVGWGRFTQMDGPEFGYSAAPLTLHKYLYGNANPVFYIDPSGHMSFGEALIVNSIKAYNFAVKAYPTVKVGLAAWDAITVVRIATQGVTKGLDTVPASDWVEFGLATAGLFGLAPGSKLVAKTLISTLIRIPIGPALRTFEGARLAIGQFVKVESVAAPLVGAKGPAAGRFLYESGGPVIKFFRTGDELFDADTLVHEFIHFLHWSMKGKPVGQAFKAFEAAASDFEDAHQVFKKIADIILELAKP